MQSGMGGVLNLFAGQIISAIMLFLRNQLFFFVSNRHFHKKCTSGKPSSQTSDYGLGKVNFLFGSCASGMNVIY